MQSFVYRKLAREFSGLFDAWTLSLFLFTIQRFKMTFNLDNKKSDCDCKLPVYYLNKNEHFQTMFQT